MYIYYFVIKMYKGLFKKKHSGNVHIFSIPVGKGVSCLLTLLGELENEENTYVFTLNDILPNEMIEKLLEVTKDDFEERFVLLDKVPCTVSSKNNVFNIKIKSKGNYILSNSTLEYQGEYKKDKIFLYKGSLNLYILGINDKQYGMMRLKKNSLVSGFFNNIKSKLQKEEK